MIQWLNTDLFWAAIFVSLGLNVLIWLIWPGPSMRRRVRWRQRGLKFFGFDVNIKTTPRSYTRWRWHFFTMCVLILFLFPFIFNLDHPITSPQLGGIDGHPKSTLSSSQASKTQVNIVAAFGFVFVVSFYALIASIWPRPFINFAVKNLQRQMKLEGLEADIKATPRALTMCRLTHLFLIFALIVFFFLVLRQEIR